METLAHTESWRNDESIEKIVKAINYHDKIMNDNNSMAIKIGSKYYGHYGHMLPHLKHLKQIKWEMLHREKH